MSARARTLAAGLLLAALAAACRDSSEQGAPEPEPPAAATPVSRWFEDVTAGTGIDFRHRHCGTGEKHLIEMIGGGVTLLDHDQDGDLDLYFPQSSALPGFDATGLDLRDRLFRNDGRLRFTDVTEEARCDEGSYSFSAANADIEGDGDPDLLVLNFGRNRLLRNDGGVFTDVTEAAGIHDELWSVVAAFADLDRDGDLDFYVANYLLYDLETAKWCGDKDKGPEWRAYCHPDEYEGAPDELYRNDGDGTFTEWTEQAGMAGANGKALGLTTADYDDDGDQDIFVANDSTPNFLWRNDGQLRFAEVATEAGVAVNYRGLSEACMGTDFGDVDNDGDLDLIVLNLAMQTNTLYVNEGGGLFSDRTMQARLDEASLPWVGFGVRFFDVDLDADQDLLLVNGHVVDNISLYNESIRFEQPAQLYWNEGSGRFAVAGHEAGAYFERMEVGRALATWDPDDDGDLDVVIVNNNAGVHLLQNRCGSGLHWIGFELLGSGQNKEAIGARVRVTAGGRTQVAEQKGASSYNATHDRRIHFGLGESERVDSVEIRWPTGGTTRLQDLAVDRYHAVTEPDA